MVMKITIGIGVSLIIIGFLNIIFTDKATKAYQSLYKYSPWLFNDSTKLKVRRPFIIAAGIVWILAGVFAILDVILWE